MLSEREKTARCAQFDSYCHTILRDPIVSHAITTEGNIVHYGFIETFIEQLGKKYNIREIAFDRWGAVQMVQNLKGMGYTVVPFGQGFKDMSPPTKELMKLTLERGSHTAVSRFCAG